MSLTALLFFLSTFSSLLDRIRSDSYTHITSPPRTCSSNYYFDSTNLTCSSCGVNMTQLAESSVYDGTGRPTACRCLPKYKRVDSTCSGDTSGTCQGFMCEQCPEAVSLDHSYCATCDNTTMYVFSV